MTACISGTLIRGSVTFDLGLKHITRQVPRAPADLHNMNCFKCFVLKYEVCVIISVAELRHFGGAGSATRYRYCSSSQKNFKKWMYLYLIYCFSFILFTISKTSITLKPGLWIRIRIGSGFRDLCGSGSVLGIRIQGQENKEISVEKCTF
jgi:hypothetical protein